MPLSALVQTSKFTTANVVRPHTQGGAKICSHGFHSRYANGQAHEAHEWTTAGRRSSRVPSKSPSSHLALHTSTAVVQLYSKTTSARTLLALLPRTSATNGLGDNYMTRRARSTITELFQGNKEYMASMSKTNPGLLASLARDGQRPPFMLVDCSDSRVNEQGIFSAQPGTIFTAGNIANRFDEDDLNSNAVLSFAVENLKVKHVVVLGHYGCGGVAASMMPNSAPLSRPADVAVQGWIKPIRDIYETSTRAEILEHREKCKTSPIPSLPDLHDPAFRALVEENVKSNVQKIANSAVIRDHYADVIKTNGSGSSSNSNSTPTASSKDKDTISEIYIHGWVYDVENGKVSDLGVSVGPPGRDLPFSPFPLIGES
ncbi:carbonic anhydrase [Flammula alnicola]|nr:carbonic anhydrase [Flammula alnicola]